MRRSLGGCFVLAGLCVMLESSKARMMPRIVMMIVMVFVSTDIVIGGFFWGRM